MADRYWVGGAGSWNSTTKWSTTSGGASGASVPTSADNAIFDANSGLTTGTVTVTTGATCANLTLSPAAAFFAPVFSITPPFTIAGTLSTSSTSGRQRFIFTSANTHNMVDVSVAAYGTLADLDFRFIRIVGAAGTLSGTRIGDLGGNQNITFSTPKTVYWNLAGAQIWTADGWAPSSGGTPAADNFPLPQDTAVFNNSSAITQISTTANYQYLPNIDMSARTSAMTFSFSANSQPMGNITLGSGVTVSGTSGVNFISCKDVTLTTAGKTITFPITITNFGYKVTLGDAFTSSNSITVVSGTFDTAGYACTSTTLVSSSTSYYRQILLNNSTVSLTSTGGAVVNLAAVNLNFNAGTSNISFTGAGGVSVTLGSQTFYNVTFPAREIIISGDNTFNNLTFTAPTSADTIPIILPAGGKQTINGTLTLSGGSNATQRRWVRTPPDVPASASELNVNAWATCNDVTFSGIAVTGAVGTLTGTRLGDAGGNSGITFDAPKTVYWNLAGTNRFDATGWALLSGGTPAVNNFPLPQDTMVFDNTGAVGTMSTGTAFTNFCFGTVDMSNRTSAMTFSFGTSSVFYVCGNWKSGTGVTFSGASATLYFISNSSSTRTVTSNGTTITSPVLFNSIFTSPIRKYELADAFSCSSGTQVTGVIFDAKTYNFTAATFTVNNAGVSSVYMGSGTWTLSGTGTILNIQGSALTIWDKGTANLVLSGNTTTARNLTVVPTSIAFNKLTIGGTSSTSTTTLNCNSTYFTEIDSTKTVAHTINSGATYGTIYVNTWSVKGTAGNLVTLSAGTSVFTIYLTAPTSGIDYLTIGASVSSSMDGYSVFYAGANSTSAGSRFVLTATPTGTTRYWVGGTGTWNATATTNWSTGSGGSSGASAPTELDDVIFDNLSNATAYTVTLSNAAGYLRVKSLTMNAPASGKVTWAGTATLKIASKLDLAGGTAGITRSYTGELYFTSNSTGCTINTNGVSLVNNIYFYGSGSWTLQSAFTTTAAYFYMIGGPTLDTAGYSLNVSTLFVVGKSTLTLGASAVTSSSNMLFYTSPWSLPTLNIGTATITNTSVAGTFTGAGLSFNNLTYSPNSASSALTLSNVDPVTGTVGTFTSVTLTVPTGVGVTGIKLNSNITITGALTANASADATKRAQIYTNNTNWIQYTISAGSTALQDVDFKDIIATGAASWTGTRIGDGGNNSGITFDTPKTVYRVANGNWSANQWAASSGASPALTNFPLAQDTIKIDANSGTGTLTYDRSYWVGTLDAASRSTAYTLAFGSLTAYIHKNLLLSSSLTTSGTVGPTFRPVSTATITSNGATFTPPIAISAKPGVAVQLGDALICAGIIQLNTGVFTTNSYSITSTSVSYFAMSANTTLNAGTTTWTFAGTATTLWNTSSATLATHNTSGLTVVLGGSSLVGKTFNGVFSATFKKLYINDGANTNTVTITNNTTFEVIESTRSSAYTFSLTTNTITVGSWIVSGSAGNVVTLSGSSASGMATLRYTGSGIEGDMNYLTLSNMRALPVPNVWYAGANSTNSGSFGFLFSNGYTRSVSETSSGVDSISATSSGGAITGTISESASGVDTVSSTPTYSRTTSETTSGVDTVSSTPTYSRTTSESASGVDSASSLLTSSRSVSESASGVDSASSLLTSSRSVSETASITNTTSATQTFREVLSVYTTGADTVSSTPTYSRTTSETTSGVDITSSLLAFLSAISEAASGIDTISASIPAFRSISETASGVDTISSTPTYPRSVSESTSATDTTSALATFLGAISETASGVDTAASLAAFVRAISEASSGVDTTAARLAFLSAISEASSSAATASALTTLLGSISESASGADVSSALATFLSSVSATASGADSIASAPTYPRAVSETASGVDSTASVPTYPGVVVETTSGVDQTSSLPTYATNVAEATAAQDTVSSLGAFNAAVAETATARDTVVSFATFICSVLVNCTVADLMAARFQWENINDVQAGAWGNLPNQQATTWTNINTQQGPDWSLIPNDQ